MESPRPEFPRIAHSKPLSRPYVVSDSKGKQGAFSSEDGDIAVPTRIYLIRHGATQLTEEDRFAGSSDVTLSDEGRRQIASLAERLKNEELDAIYTSPLIRTVETARILAAPHRLEPIAEPQLKESTTGAGKA